MKKGLQKNPSRTMANPIQVLEFLDQFQQVVAGQEGARKLISLRVPERLLEQFKLKSKSQGFAYQTQIVRLMREWVGK